MKRIIGEINFRQWMLTPSIGIKAMWTEYYEPKYAHRLVFGWLCFYISIGIVRTRKEMAKCAK
jgi:hypothetical protein